MGSRQGCTVRTLVDTLLHEGNLLHDGNPLLGLEVVQSCWLRGNSLDQGVGMRWHSRPLVVECTAGGHERNARHLLLLHDLVRIVSMERMQHKVIFKLTSSVPFCLFALVSLRNFMSCSTSNAGSRGGFGQTSNPASAP